MNESSIISDLQSLTDLPTLELKARRIVEGITAGRNRSSRHGISTDFSQHREYTPGDDLRHIDWKVYGRSDRYFLKRYVDETTAQIIILLDCSRSMSFQSQDSHTSKWNYGLLLSAALFWMGLQQGHAVGIHCFADESVIELRPGSSRGQFTRFQNAIGGLQCDGKTNFGSVSRWLPIRLGQRKMLFVISDFFDEVTSIDRFFQRLEFDHHDVSAIQIYDPLESQGPNVQSEYVDSETGHKLFVDADRIRPTYQKLFTAFQTDLRKIWSRYRAIGQMARTSDHPSKLLRELLDRREDDVRR